MSKSENGIIHTSRLCHVIKVEDFDGYGFNLHAEKGKPGQYIGKVDDGSPAEQAGLKQGDRIIEVNGVNIGTETHKQVVQRIKAIANEVRLLVVDHTVPVNKDNQIIDETNLAAEKSINVDDPEIHTAIPSQSSSLSKSSPDIIVEGVPQSPAKNGSNINFENNSIIMPLNEKKSENADPSKLPETNRQNGTSTKTHGLNLNMTAAELRAKLAAKKKFDPKNDSVDLRKKFEIVQKL